MSLITGLQKSEIPDFMGANYRGESSDVRPPWLLRATNVQFEEGYVRSRRGVYTHPSKNVGTPVNGFYNMLIGDKSWVLSAEDDGVQANCRYGEYNAAASVLALNTGSVGATFASIGDRAYIASFDINYALGQLSILDDLTTSPTVRQTWIPPLTNTYMAGWTFNMVNTASANYATPGTHNFALAFTSDTGFITRASPNLNGNTSPYQTAVTAGNKLVITVTPDAGHKWPAYKSVWLIATTTRNLNKYYFVAGSEQTVPDATTTALVFEFAIQDSALVGGTPFDNYENVMYNGQFTANTAPLLPYYIFNCGERMGYFFQDPGSLGYGIAISDPNDPEHITLDQHIIYLPKRAKPIAAKWTQSTIYIFTENGTFGYNDNGDVPVTWATPRTIDDKVGTQVPYGISLDSNGYGFVAHRTGLYAFNGGLYDSVPLSYYVAEDPSGTMQSWDKIKWNYASAYPFVVVDDKENFRVIVKASNISGSDVVHTWNYLSGKSAKDVRYSNWTFNNDTVPAWVAIVQNNGDSISATRRQQLWLEFGSSNTPWLLERPSEIQTNKYVDTLAVGFDFRIDPALYFPFLPERPIEAGENRQHYTRLRLRGSGTINFTIKGIDELLSIGPLTQTLSTTKARDVFFGYSMISESASVRLTLTGAVGSWFELSNFVQYWKWFVAKQ